MESDSPQREMVQLSHSPTSNVPPSASTVTPVIQVISSPDVACNSTSASVSDTNTNDPNWQATKTTLRERNAAMFDNELMADIRFIVGNAGKN